MTTVLLTGFEPFDGDSVNPSWDTVQRLQGETIAGAQVVSVRLPCVFGVALRVLEHATRLHRPTTVIAVGQAGGRSDITPERVAINLNDARISDNAGKQPTDQAIRKLGPAAYFSTLPVKAIVQALLAQGLPASVSHSAGTFVCNHVFYGLMHHAAVHGQPYLGGLLHVPFLPQRDNKQAPAENNAASMALEDIVRGIIIVLEAAAVSF